MNNESPILVEIQTIKEGPSHTKKISEQIRFPFKPFRSKTRSTNKLRMNMKALLNPRVNKRQVISVQDTSSGDGEDNRARELELVINQVFDNINQSLKQILDIGPKSCIYNSSNIEDDNLSEFTETEEGKTSEKQSKCNEQVLTEQ